MLQPLLKRANICSSGSQFYDLLTLTSNGKLQKSNHIDILESRGSAFGSEATRDQLIQFPSKEEGASRRVFRKEFQSFVTKLSPSEQASGVAFLECRKD